MKYYLIHGLALNRRIFMKIQFMVFGISRNEVTWINHSNKGELLPEGICKNSNLTVGQIAITYKHFLALQDMVLHGYPVAVIMEDNISFLDNVPAKIEKYLSQLPPDWDLLFDSDFGGWLFIESPTDDDKLVYLKSNYPTEQCAGATKGAHFYIVNLKAAKLLVDNFLPFSDVSDWYLCQLIRDLNLRTFWANPSNVHKIGRRSTWK